MKSSFQEVDRQLLGFQGRLYPSDMVIEVRGADVPEIRAWSNINDKDFTSIAKHINDIVTACTRVTCVNNTRSYSVKDLYVHDKLTLLLYIHELTFADKHANNLSVSGECSNPLCGKVFDQLVITPANLKFKEPDEKFIKYIDAEEGKFVIQTKNYGTIEYKPITIGLDNATSSWLQGFKPAFVRENTSMIRVVQSLVTDWRQANDKYLRRLQIEQYNNMNAEALSFRLSLIDQLEIALKEELEYVCPDCGATFRSRLELTGGYKQMFVPVQDIDAELL